MHLCCFIALVWFGFVYVLLSASLHSTQSVIYNATVRLYRCDNFDRFDFKLSLLAELLYFSVDCFCFGSIWWLLTWNRENRFLFLHEFSPNGVSFDIFKVVESLFSPLSCFYVRCFWCYSRTFYDTLAMYIVYKCLYSSLYVKFVGYLDH